ncbi:MAG: hypothetical protein QM765_17425 [Myxococcales bacterium]
MSCPTPEEVAAFVDGQASQDAATLERHFAECAKCRQHREHFEHLAQAMRSAVPAPDPAFVAQVQRKIAARQQTSRASAGLGLVLAAGVAATVVVLVRGRTETSELAPRGGPVSAAAAVGFEASLHPSSAPAKATRLEEGAALTPGDGLTFTLYNRTGQARFVMLLAQDAKGQVHWFHPAYLSVKDDPASLPVPATPQVVELSEGVTPEDLAPGALVLYALFSEAALHVRQVEAELAKDPAGLAKIPGVQVERQKLVVRGGSP